MSSTNAVRYASPAGRPLDMPIACRIDMKRPSSTRAPGTRATASSTRCFTPASASTLPATNSSAEPCVVSARMSCAFFNVRVRNKS